ncbi:insulinase family protein [Candidatus Saganbacteria bacterium]|uniref:Insulinase family protein n=1 Tax=Candidatus Saganbacteria bacterium TaxID=2575572 RepID=A0A9D6YVN3_UNCSA|nr:insulinase family protein [Candidatus Saganbacteria bacterium]
MTTIPQAKKIILPNGIKVLTEEIPSLRSVAVGIMVGAGSGNEEPKEAGISHYIEHMTFKGTARRTAFEIAHALDAVGGKINAYTSKEATVYYAVVLDQHLDTAMDVLCDMVLNSLYDPKEMETEKGVILEEIKMYEDTPDELIHDYFVEQIIRGHPLGKPTIGFAETVRIVKREDIIDYRRRLYSPRNIIISLAGAVPDRIEEKLKFYFEKFEGRGVSLSQPLPQIRGGINLKKKKTEQVHLCLGAKGPSQVEDDHYPYAVLDNILGGNMSSHLFQEVREKRGLVYSIFSTTASFRDFGISYVYAGTSRENMTQVIDLILEQFVKIKKEGLTKEELEKGKEYLKGTLVLGLESSSSRMSWMAKSEFYYDRVMTVDEVFERVDRVTNEDILRLANRYFRDEYLTLAVIADMDELPVKELHC